jgi:hypothetical protein
MLSSLTYHIAMQPHEERLRTADRRRAPVGPRPRITRSPRLRGR